MNPILIKIVIKVIMSMKIIVCSVSVGLAVSNEKIANVRLKPLVLQEQQFKHFGLKSTGQ